MYDPISGNGKIPAADYSKKAWYQEWLKECRRADAYMGKAANSTFKLDKEEAQVEKEIDALFLARRKAYNMPNGPDRRAELRRIGRRICYLRNRKVNLEKQREIDRIRRTKQKAPQPAATELQGQSK